MCCNVIPAAHPKRPNDKDFLVFISFIILRVVRDWIHSVRRSLLGPLGLCATTRMIDECGGFDGKRIGRRKRSSLSKPAPVPLSLPQILRDLAWDSNWAAAMWSRRLKAMARSALRVTEIMTEWRLQIYTCFTAWWQISQIIFIVIFLS